MNNLVKDQSIPLSTKVAYGFGGFGMDLASGIVALYAMFYFTDILHISPAFIGTLFLVARIWDAFNDPIMGILVDNTKSKFGRIRIWLLIGAIVNTAMIIAMFNAHWISGTMLYVYVSITYVIWGMAFTSISIPFWCILPNIARSDKQKSSLVIWPRTMISVAWLIMGSGFFILVEYFGGDDQAHGFSIVALLTAGVFLLSMLSLIVSFKENTQNSSTKHSIKDFISLIKKNDQLLIIFVTLFLFFNIVGTVLFFAIYYFTYVVKSQDLFAIFMLVAGLTEVFTQLIIPQLLKRMSRDTLVKISYLLPILGCCVLAYSSFLDIHNVWLIGIGSALVRAGHGFMLVLMIIMLTDCMDYGELKTGKRAEGVIMAAMPMQFKLGNAVTGFIMGLVLTFSGYIPNVEQSEITIFSMQLLFLLFPVLVAIGSYYLYSHFYKLKGKYLEDVKYRLLNKLAFEPPK